MPMISGYK